MIRLSYPTLAVMAKALLVHRAARADSLAYWQGCSKDPLAPEMAESCAVELAAVDNALREFQAAAPSYLSGFLQRQIDLIHPTTTVQQPSTQEAT
jgi:hypothetical protein